MNKPKPTAKELQDDIRNMSLSWEPELTGEQLEKHRQEWINRIKGCHSNIGSKRRNPYE